MDKLFFLFIVLAINVVFAAQNRRISDSDLPKARLTPTLSLQDAYTTPRATDATYVSTSWNGSLVFAAFLGAPFTSNFSEDIEEAVLFRNVAGTLVRLNTLVIDEVAQYSTGAAASRDFSRFLIVDHDWDFETNRPITTRLRLFNQNLDVPIATRMLTDPFILDGDVTAPIISFNDNNTLIAITVDGLSAGQLLQQPKILLLDGTTLATRVTFDFQTEIDSDFNYSTNGAYFFSTLTCAPSCIVVDRIVSGYSQYDDISITHFFMALEVVPGINVTITSTVEVPQMLVDMRSIPYKVPKFTQNLNQVFLVTTSARADTGNEITSVMNDSRTESTSPGDSAELKVWRFFNTNLFDIAEYNVEQNAEGACLNPKDMGNSMLVVVEAQPTNPVDLTDPETGRELNFRLRTNSEVDTTPEIVNGDRSYSVGNVAKSVQFDTTGSWVVVGTSKGPQAYSDYRSRGISANNGLWQNVLLFDVTYYIY